MELRRAENRAKKVHISSMQAAYQEREQHTLVFFVLRLYDILPKEKHWSVLILIMNLR